MTQKTLIGALAVSFAMMGTGLALKAADRMRITMEGVTEGDTVRLRPHWSRSKDAKGRTDSIRYIWAVYRGKPTRSIIANGITSDTAAIHSVLFPAPGDTVWYSSSVQAQDSRNWRSTIVYSNYVAVTTPWVEPTPPTIQLDTDTIQADSLSLTALLDNVTMPLPLLIVEGQAVQMCAILWREGEPFLAYEQRESCAVLLGLQVGDLLYDRRGWYHT